MPRVLVVDDDVFTAMLVEEAVQDWTVDAIHDSLLALDKLRRERVVNELPDVILLDINMPGVNGYQACVTMRLIAPEVPVAPYTAAQHVRADYLSELGCCPVIYKGISADELGTHLRTILTSHVPVAVPTATLMELYRESTIQEEIARRERASTHVGLLASSMLERMGLKTLLDANGAQVVAVEGHDADLRPALAGARCAALVTSMRDRTMSLACARALNLPVLFIIDNVEVGQELLWHFRNKREEWPHAAGIITIASLTRVPLAQVLHALDTAGVYLDPGLAASPALGHEQAALGSYFRNEFGIDLSE